MDVSNDTHIPGILDFPDIDIGIGHFLHCGIFHQILVNIAAGYLTVTSIAMVNSIPRACKLILGP